MVKKKGNKVSASRQTHQAVNSSKAKATPKTKSNDIPVKPLTAKERRKLNQLIKEDYWRTRRRYREIHGKILDWVSHSIEDGDLNISIRFKDKTEFSLRFSPKIIVGGIDLFDVKTGNFKLLREYPRIEQAL